MRSMLNAPVLRHDGLNGDQDYDTRRSGAEFHTKMSAREIVSETDVHRDVVLTRRAMDSLGIDKCRVPDSYVVFRHASSARNGSLA